jgi:hypothetical protein
MKNPVRTGTMIALTAASLFAAACGSKSPDASKSTMPAGEKTAAAVHCNGANACKGQGSCKGAQNACKGQNSCKGAGFVETASADECTTKGGTVAPAAPAPAN